jgi:hypothetical protein
MNIGKEEYWEGNDGRGEDEMIGIEEEGRIGEVEEDGMRRTGKRMGEDSIICIIIVIYNNSIRYNSICIII